MRSPDSLSRAVQGVDGVIHCAGLTTARTSDDYRQVNDEGTRVLAQAAAGADVSRFVYVSSLAAQGPSPDGRIYDPMEVEPAPRSRYGKSKLAGERHVLELKGRMSAASIRCPVIYGPRDRALLPFFQFVKFRLMPMYGDGSNRIALVYVKDAAAALVCALEARGPAGSVYTISDGEAHTWRSLGTLVGEAIGDQPLKLRVPGPLYAFAGLAGSGASAVLRTALPMSRDRAREFAQPFWVCGNERITRELGWKPVFGAAAGLRETVEWYRHQGWL
jgi:nucleoside-diphosphate-sugar epimerase